MASLASPPLASATPTSNRKRPSDTIVTESLPLSSSSSLLGTETPAAAAAASAKSIPTPSPRRIQFRVTRIHAVARWTWNANDDVCGICQTAYEGTAPQVKYPGEDCPVVWGRCGHAYHLQCLTTWLQQPASKNSCPLCRQEWEFGQNPTGNNNSSSNSDASSNNNNGSDEGTDTT